MNEVLVYGGIYDFTAEAFVRSFAELEGDSLVCRINTNGGGVEAGWSMIAKFMEFEGQKTVKIDGSAKSMGANFCLYADDVECLDVSQIMVHRASFGEWYESSAYFTDEKKQWLTNVNAKLKEAFVNKIDVAKFENLKQCKTKGITVDKLFSMDSIVDVFMTADDAKKIGLVNRIVKITPAKANAINNSIAALVASGNDFSELIVKVPEIVAENPVNTGIENVNLITMNKVKLQAEHPELFAEIMNLGVAQERDRVGAWTAFIDVDAKAVKDGIASGESLTQTAMAEFSVKMFSTQKAQALKEESEKTPGAEAGADGTPPAGDLKAEAKQALQEEINAKLGIQTKKD